MNDSAVAQPSPPPQRRAVFGALLLNLAVSPLFIWNVLAQPLAEELAVSSAHASLVFSLGLAAFSVGVLAGGPLADRIAPRRLALACAGGSAAGLALAAVAPSLWLVIIGFGVIQGVAVGLGYATAVHVAGMINRGIVMALVVSAYGAGSALLAPFADALLAAYGRMPTLLGIAALTGLIALAAAALLPQRRTRPETAASRSTPVDAKQRPMIITLLWLTFGLGSAPGLAAFAFASDFTNGAAAAAVAALSLGNFGGRLAAGWLADRLGVAWALHAFCLLLIAACLALIPGPGLWVGLAALLAIGTQYGALSTLVPLATRSAVPAPIFGRVFGLVFSAWGVFGLGAPAVVAALLSSGGASTAAGAMLGCALLGWLLAAALVLWLSRHRGDSPARE